MAMQQDNDNGLLLVGTLYARNRRIPDSQRENVGNGIQLVLTPKSETKVRVSRQKETAGSALDSVVIKGATEVKLGADTFNKLTLAMALSGKSVELAAEAKSVSDEVVSAIEKGVWLPLANRNIDKSSVKVKNASGQAVKPEYIEVNPTLGWVKVLADADNVNAKEDIKVSYKTNAGGGIRIEAGTENDYDLEIWLDGFNNASYKNFVLHIPSVVVAPTSEIDWLGEEYAKAEFGGNVVLVDGNKSPYSYEEFNA